MEFNVTKFSIDICQFDKKWEADRGFVFYDFKQPDVFPKELLGTFDMVVVDPPFITHAVWENYAVTTKLLLKKGTSADGSPSGKVILTTLQENAEFLQILLGAKPTVSDAAAEMIIKLSLDRPLSNITYSHQRYAKCIFLL